jgi:O-antigen/teichoic acid export membrane protein
VDDPGPNQILNVNIFSQAQKYLGKCNVGVLARLGALRVLILFLMFFNTILVVRYLSVEEMGRYYVISTVSYFGNAVIYVGSDMYLQQVLAEISKTNQINAFALFKYFAITVSIGAVVLALGAGMYFANDRENGFFYLTLLCVLSSVSTYIIGSVRNLFQLAALPVYSSLITIAETAFKSTSLFILAADGRVTGINIVLCNAVVSIILAAIFLKIFISMMKCSEGGNISYLNTMDEYVHTVVSIGAGGLLNWVQLQGYRLLLAKTMENGITVVGRFAFMSTLGITISGAVFSILAQVHVPVQYSSRGISTQIYIGIIGKMTVILFGLSLPAGLIFIWLNNKMELIPILYVVAVGVLVEGGNAALGGYANHMNVNRQNMRVIPFAGLIGCFATFCCLTLPDNIDVYLKVSVALVVGQIVALSVVMIKFFAKKRVIFKL